MSAANQLLVSLAEFSSVFQWVCTAVYMCFILAFMVKECRLMVQLKWGYFRQMWSWIEWGIIGCSWASLGVAIARYKTFQHVSRLFQQTNGYASVNLQLASYGNDLLRFLFGFCWFFGIMKFLRLCRFSQRLSLFSRTMHHARASLFAFLLMFSVIFLAFLTLFYLMFTSSLSDCASLLSTARMLFEMSMYKFDATGMQRVAPVLGPLCLILFVVCVVFVCFSMFASIVSDAFRRARKELDDDRDIFLFMVRTFLQWTGEKRERERDGGHDVFFSGLKKASEWESQEKRDSSMRGEYVDPSELLAAKMDELVEALDRVRIVPCSLV